MNENNLNNIIPAVVEATTLNIVSLSDNHARLSTDDGKELNIILVPGTIKDYLVKGELHFAVVGKEDLIETLRICFPKFDDLDPIFEPLLEDSLKTYSKSEASKNLQSGTFCIAEISKSKDGEIIREYIECYRGYENAVRWIHNFMMGHHELGYKYMFRNSKCGIYKRFADGSTVTYIPYHLSNQEPTHASAKYYLEMAN